MINTKKLDETDKQIIEGIKQGKSYKDISKTIFISISAIKKRVRSIKDNTDCNKLPELVCKLSAI